MKLNNNDDSHNSGLNLLIYNMLLDIESHPAWVCGLKLICPFNALPSEKSHPAWVCGLKQTISFRQRSIRRSHPAWVCGLKLPFRVPLYPFKMSHPAWVCGLKHIRNARSTILAVTPCVGVWIETFVGY